MAQRKPYVAFRPFAGIYPFTGADFQYPQFSAEEQRGAINADTMLRSEDAAVATHFMLTQTRRTAISLMRVEPRFEH